MVKFIKLLIVFLIIDAGSSAPVRAWDQTPPMPLDRCNIQAPFGMPTAQAVQPICRPGYLVGYDPDAKLPRFVIYTLQPGNALGCIPRSNAFVADKSIQTNGATPRDYVGTGFDKGHMAPDGDLSYNQQVEYESFLMTNMSPQAGSLNRGIWKLLETSIRGWAVEQNHSFTIYVGSIYNSQDRRIGSGVVVPHAFYKIVIDDVTQQVAGWVFPHTPPYPNLGNDLTKFRTPISQIQSLADVKFAFPPTAQELSPGREWPIDFGALVNAKHVRCGPNASVD